MIKENIKRHLISATITFLATFFLVVAFALKDDTFVITKTSIQAVLFSGIVAGVRAVSKVVYELCYSLLSTKE